MMGRGQLTLWAMGLVLVLAGGLGVGLWWQAQPPGPVATEENLGTAESPENQGKHDAALSQVAASEDAAAPPGTSKSAESSAVPRPAGERLRPGAAPAAGMPFTTTARSGLTASGTFFRAAAARAPLLVLMGEHGADVEAWQTTLQVLRGSRDYHLVVVRPPVTRLDGAETVEASTAVEILEAALTWSEARLQGALQGTALVGAGLGAAAAVLLAAERRDILAIVAISPPARLGKFRLSEALERIRDRQSRWFGADGDERSAGMLTLAKTLPMALVTVRPGKLRGVGLLRADRRSRTALAGWLFAIMPEAVDP